VNVPLPAMLLPYESNINAITLLARAFVGTNAWKNPPSQPAPEVKFGPVKQPYCPQMFAFFITNETFCPSGMKVYVVVKAWTLTAVWYIRAIAVCEA